MEIEELRNLAYSFFEWPTEDRTQVTLTSALLFAQHVLRMAQQQAEPTANDGVVYICHRCKAKTNPPGPFKFYVSCDFCGELTAASAAEQAQYSDFPTPGAGFGGQPLIWEDDPEPQPAPIPTAHGHSNPTARDWEMKAQGIESVIHYVVSKSDQDLLRKCAADKRAEGIRAAYQDVQPTPIPTSERLPTQDDADYLGKVWAFGNLSGWYIDRWDILVEHPEWFTHWLPTGLKMPPAPGGSDE